MTEDVKNQPSDGEQNPDTNQDDVKDKGSKTFTQEELGKKLSEERKRAREQYEKDLDDRIAKERERWEKEAKMTEEQKAAEAQKEQKEALDKREREITLRERKAEALEALAEKHIPASFADYIIDADGDKMSANIEKLEKTWGDELQKAVKEAAAGTTPEDKAKNPGAGKSSATSSNVFRGNGVAAF
jgi:hypothetical protein